MKFQRALAFILGALLGAVPVLADFQRFGSSSGGSITIGTSLISGGADGDILYNNGGVVGGFAIYDDTGAGNGAFALRKTPSGSSATSNFFSVTGTMPATLSALTWGANYQITGAGSSGQHNAALNVDYLAGYTGGFVAVAGRFINANATTGNTVFAGTGGSVAVMGATTGAATVAIATQGLITSGAPTTGYALFGNTVSGTTRIGAAGFASGGTTNVGGYFGYNGAAPTFASAALMADNAAVAADIFVARDNGTAVFTIADGARSATFDSNGLGLGGAAASGFELHVVTAGSTDVMASTSSTGGYGNFQARNDTGAGGAEVLVTSYGSAFAGTLFGINKANGQFVWSSGTSSIGLGVGTTTDDPLILGRLDEQRYQIGPQKTLTDNTIATFATETLGNDTGGGGTIHYCVFAADATTNGLECGNVDFAGTDATAGAGGETCPTPTKVGTPLQALNGSTLTVTFAATTGTDLCNIRVTADTNIATPTALWIKWNVNNSGRVIAAQ